MIDLHLHSNCSDGTMTPTKLLEEAMGKKLYAISLTDHDSVEGIYELEDQKVYEKIHFIPGIELSCEAKGREVHILGYGIDIRNESLLQGLEDIRKGRANRNQEVIDLFYKDGISISVEELQHGNPDTVITRAHFARVLVEQGICKSKDEAFRKYLGDGCKYYVKKPFFDPKDAMDLIAVSGGISVLAHPFQYGFSNKELEDFIASWKEDGLGGLEVYHPSQHIGQSSRLKEWCKKYQLLETGGSDFHGSNKPKIHMGSGYGGMNVPDVFYERLKNRCCI